MSKINKVIAGLGVVAGLGVALAPVATFAETAIGQDTLTVTVNSSCTLDTTVNSGNAFQGAYAGETSTIGAGVMVALNGQTGSSNQVAFDCNENSGITITAATGGLALSGNVDTIAADHIKANYTGANGLTITSGYTSTDYGALDATKVVATGTAGSGSNMTFTVDGYKAVLKAGQKSGIYTGTVSYTFDLVNN